MKSRIDFLVRVIIEPDTIGFHAYCPGLPGVHGAGDTQEDALHDVAGAADLMIKARLKQGDPPKANADLIIINHPSSTPFLFRSSENPAKKGVGEGIALVATA